MHVDLYLFRKYTVFSLTLRTARPRMLRSFIFRRVIGGKCVRRIQLQSDTCDEKKKRISSVFSDYFWAWNRILCFSYSLDGANWRQRKKSAVYKWCGAISTETKPKRSCKCAFRITSKNSFCLFQFQGSFHRRSLRVHKRKKKRPKSNCTRELPHHTNECISAARLHNEPRRIEIFFVSRARAHWMWKLKTQFIALFTLRRSFVLAMRANQNCGMNALRRVTFN